MNDLKYVEENSEYFFPSNSLDEPNNSIKELLEKNGSLQEVRKLKREQEIQSIKLCEILEQRNKAKEDLEARNNENKISPISMKTLLIKSKK